MTGGAFPDDEGRCTKLVKHGDVFEPNLKNSEIYEKLYQRVYKKMYSNLQRLYSEIKDITGYPEL